MSSEASSGPDEVARATQNPSRSHSRQISRRQRRSASRRQEQPPQPRRSGLGLPSVDDMDVESTRGGGGKDDTLKLRLDLNLDVAVELRAKVHGDVTLSLL